MRGRIDAEREAADDRDTRACERGGEALGVGDALLRGVAAADDGDRGAVQQFEPADREQHGRRVRVVSSACGYSGSASVSSA